MNRLIDPNDASYLDSEWHLWDGPAEPDYEGQAEPVEVVPPPQFARQPYDDDLPF